MGMCNYCNELTKVYEQEDEHRSLFLVCKSCIKDIFVRIDIDEARDQ
jgi:translation initiation factor 2 beta subunit (eIF-2beta)/eIF-5